MEKVTMSVQELSAQMGISLPKAYELVKTPGFPIIRVGTRILIPVEAYREWLLKNAVKDLGPRQVRREEVRMWTGSP